MGGSVAMYQAMTRMGHATGTDFKAPPNPLRRRPRHHRPRAGRGPGRHAGRLRAETAPATASACSSSRPAPAAATTPCAAATALTELGGATQKDRLRARQLHQPRAVAHSVSPPGDTALLQGIRRSTRAVHRAEPQRLPARYRTASAARRSATGMWRAISTGYTAELLSKAINQKMPRRRDEPPKRAADILHNMRVWGMLDQRRRLHRAASQRAPRLREAPRRAGRTARACRPSLCRGPRSCAPACRSIWPSTCSMISRPRCSSRSAGWT